MGGDAELPDADDDDISLTSTAPGDELSEYEVNGILAEIEDPEYGKRYLVDWKGYERHEATWEPIESFTSEETLQQWEQKRKAIEEGKEQPFDVEAWEAEKDEIERATAERKRRRAAKRQRLIRAGFDLRPLRRSSDNFTQRPVLKTFLDDPETGRNLDDRRRSVVVTSASRQNLPSVVGAGLHRKNPVQTNVLPRRVSSDVAGVPKLVAKRTGQTAPRAGPVIAAPKASSILPFTTPKSSGPQLSNPVHAPKAGNKLFNLSTKRRHEKAKGNEPPPDISKLELMRPSEWQPADSAVIGSRRRSSITSPTSVGSLFEDNELFVPMEDPAPAVPTSPPQLETLTNARDMTTFASPSSEQVGESPARYTGQESLSATTARPEPPLVIRTSQGLRQLEKGDILVTLLYGPAKKHVGPVRLRGLTVETKKRLLGRKRDAHGALRTHELEVWFQHFLTLREYDMLCQNVDNRKYSNGWIEAFSDTEQNLREMGSELREQEVIAVRIPESRSENVFVAYWGASTQFQFFNDAFTVRPDSISLAVRGMLGPIERLQSLRSRGLDVAADLQLSTMLRQASEGTRLPLPEKPPAQPLPSESALAAPSRALQVSHTFPEKIQAEDDNRDGIPMDISDGEDYTGPKKRSISPIQDGPAAPQLVQFQGQLNIRDVFLQSFSITFQKLATFGPNAASDFYLMFPESDPASQQEFDLIRLFLIDHKARIFSIKTPTDWTSFSKVSRNGAVIFHSSFENYYELPNLDQLLSKPCNFWRVSLRTPLPSASPPRHFERIFPHGGVFLITEDFMATQPEAATIVLYWFNEIYVKERYPGHWKLMVRPNALTWLLQKHDSSKGDDAIWWLLMYQLIRQLIPNTPFDADVKIDLDGFHNPTGPNNVFIPSKLQRYCLDNPKSPEQMNQDTDLLVEYFAGWAIMCCHHFRRFVVLCEQRQPMTRWLSWNHLEIKCGAKEFMKWFNVDYRSIHKNLRRRASAPSEEGKHASQQPPHSTPHSTFTPRTPKPVAVATNGEKAGSASEDAPSRRSTKYNYPQPYQ